VLMPLTVIDHDGLAYPPHLIGETFTLRRLGDDRMPKVVLPLSPAVFGSASPLNGSITLAEAACHPAVHRAKD